MSGLYRNDDETPEGKYPIVIRRDGSAVTHRFFVLLLRDPCAEAALLAYAAEAERRGYDPEYVAEVRQLAAEAPAVRDASGPGAPDAPPDRPDDPVTLAWARSLGCPGS